MPKTFYTEVDIEEMARRGQTSLQVGDDVTLTDLAYEKARKLGLQLVTGTAENPPAAPVRPYISQTPAAKPQTASAPASGDLAERIRSAVLAKLGDKVDPALLDTIIQRVLASTGMK